ncbi:helix-turn-helix domain-containing protein [Herbiconiux ginsengi]|uniref:Helix-turn-helix domain-containing protein n=1 Tax=Herbiconiux ginsengi TaxID=381665 RepID=A0A1H3PN85_9MICO|nr:helix-turn-helix domain-containing protein [Herbiconiux ginsengi]SDZ02486.1 Helix-turn-helix domain-containing protein [Herbiconiux ginsengi]
MSLRALVWAWGQVPLTLGEDGSPPLVPKPSLAAKLVLMALADYADEAGSCFPSHATLSAMCCMSTKTVSRAIEILERRELLTREQRRRGNGSRTSDRYVLHLNGAPEKQPDNLSGSGRPQPDNLSAPNGQSVGARSIYLTDETDQSLLLGTDRAHVELETPSQPGVDTAAVAVCLRNEGLNPDQYDIARAISGILGRTSVSVARPAAYVAKGIRMAPDEWLVRQRPRTVSCDAGHKWWGPFNDRCLRCDEERPNWRDDRDAAQAA